jgi:NTP pyrophosphatase (non-canonical NTP hydrolase)
VELGELAKHIAKLRDTDVTNKFADEIASLESCLKNTDEKGYEVINEELNRLAKRIKEESIIESEERNETEC